MIIKMKIGAEKEQIEKVKGKIKNLGYKIDEIVGEERIFIGIKGDVSNLPEEKITSQEGVEEIIRISRKYKLASLEYKVLLNNNKQHYTKVKVNGTKVGGKKLVIIAGPCSVESERQILESANFISKLRNYKNIAKPMLRGGAFKPRSSPYSFQGLGKKGLKLLRKAKDAYNLSIVTEVMEPNKVKLVAEYADILQIGTRNMQNYDLLKKVGKSNKPVLLKRGFATTLEEFLQSAEYIMSNGNKNVILCLRGIRTYNTGKLNYRNHPDLSDIVALREETHLPIIFDPSHSTGKRNAVTDIALMAITGGADGLIVEMHPNPSEALSDGNQSLYPKQLKKLFEYANRTRGNYLLNKQ